MCVVMLALPMTSVLLATLLLFSDGLAVIPLVIVAVVVAHGPPPGLRPPSISPGRRPVAPSAAESGRAGGTGVGGTPAADNTVGGEPGSG
jgi:hypothetical protein